MRLCYDAGPIENLHRVRGIGWSTLHLLRALADEPLQESDTLVALARNRPDLGSAGARVEFACRSRTAEFTGVGGRVAPFWAERWKAIESSLFLPRDIEATGADVFLATDPQAVAHSRRFRTIATSYDLIPLLFAEHYLPRGAVLGRAIYFNDLRRLARADHVLAISEATRADLVTRLGLSPDRVTAFHLGVDGDIFQPASDAAMRKIAADYDLYRPYFLYVGGFDPRKNLEALIEAFLAADLADATLAIVGPMEGPGERLRARTADRAGIDRVRWLGYVPLSDLPPLYSGALALTFPSAYEGFGLPVLEAMNCGTPVLTTRRSSLPEVAGDAALYIDPTAPGEFSAALRRLATETALREELRGQGLARAEGFTWARSAARVRQVCEAVAAGRSPGLPSLSAGADG